MTSIAPFTAPTALMMLEAFGVEPSAAEPRDGFFAWTWTDDRGVSLRLSWDNFQRSVQVALTLHGRPLMTVCEEGATALRVEDRDGHPALRGEFHHRGARGQVLIDVQPEIRVEWGVLEG